MGQYRYLSLNFYFLSDIYILIAERDFIHFTYGILVNITVYETNDILSSI